MFGVWCGVLFDVLYNVYFDVVVVCGVVVYGFVCVGYVLCIGGGFVCSYFFVFDDGVDDFVVCGVCLLLCGVEEGCEIWFDDCMFVL